MSLMSGSGLCSVSARSHLGHRQCQPTPVSSQPSPKPPSPPPALQSQRPFPSLGKTGEGPPGTEVTQTPDVEINFLPRIPKCPEPKKHQQPSCGCTDPSVRTSPGKIAHVPLHSVPESTPHSILPTTLPPTGPAAGAPSGVRPSMPASQPSPQVNPPRKSTLPTAPRGPTPQL